MGAIASQLRPDPSTNPDHTRERSLRLRFGYVPKCIERGRKRSLDDPFQRKSALHIGELIVRRLQAVLDR